MVSRSRRCAAARNFRISNSSMPKALTTRFPLTVLNGTADAPAQFSYWPNDQRQKYCRAEGHGPIEAKKNGNKHHQRKTLAEQIGEILRNSEARALHIINHRGHQPARRLVLEKRDGLANQLRVDFIAQIGDCVVPHGLNESIPEKLSNRLDSEYHQKRNRNDGPDVMNPRREEMVQINRFVNAGYREKRKRGVARGRIQDPINNRDDQEDDEPLGQRHNRKEHHTRNDPEKVGSDITQQAF